MNSKIKIDKLDPNDKASISKIADWYFKAWNTPTEKTIKRLTNQSNDDTIFQAILTIDGQLVATGGLCVYVNIYNQYPELKAFKPWVGLLYTQAEFRNKGFGQKLLEFIEYGARAINHNKIYLYTFTAQSFYERNGWTVIKSLYYKHHNTHVMRKKL